MYLCTRFRKQTNNKTPAATENSGKKDMKTSTNKEIKGWRNTFTPKDLTVNVREWLLENGQDEDDATIFDAETTFADLKSCLAGKDQYGVQEIDYDKLGQFCCTNALDSFLRDITFDALSAINK